MDMSIGDGYSMSEEDTEGNEDLLRSMIGVSLGPSPVSSANNNPTSTGAADQEARQHDREASAVEANPSMASGNSNNDETDQPRIEQFLEQHMDNSQDDSDDPNLPGDEDMDAQSYAKWPTEDLVTRVMELEAQEQRYRMAITRFQIAKAQEIRQKEARGSEFRQNEKYTGKDSYGPFSVKNPKSWRFEDFTQYHGMGVARPDGDGDRLPFRSAEHPQAAQFLSDSTSGMLCELTVDFCLLRAKNALRARRFSSMRRAATKALALAEGGFPDYAPLHARCHVYIGIAQYHTGEATAALENLLLAQQCKAVYPEGDYVERYIALCREILALELDKNIADTQGHYRDALLAERARPTPALAARHVAYYRDQLRNLFVEREERKQAEGAEPFVHKNRHQSERLEGESRESQARSEMPSSGEPQTEKSKPEPDLRYDRQGKAARPTKTVDAKSLRVGGSTAASKDRRKATKEHQQQQQQQQVGNNNNNPSQGRQHKGHQNDNTGPRARRPVAAGTSPAPGEFTVIGRELFSPPQSTVADSGSQPEGPYLAQEMMQDWEDSQGDDMEEEEVKRSDASDRRARAQTSSSSICISSQVDQAVAASTATSVAAAGGEPVISPIEHVEVGTESIGQEYQRPLTPPRSPPPQQHSSAQDSNGGNRRRKKNKKQKK